jgi:Tol biopolymer transport system component
VRRALSRCLRRDRNERWRDIGDARLELLTPSQRGEQSSASHAKGRAWLAWALAAICLLVAIVSLAINLTPSRGRAPAIYAGFAAPDGAQFVYNDGPPAVSPDGTQVAFVAANDTGERYLYVRNLHEPGAQRLDGTKGAAWPFWSPDSRSIAYVDGTHLRRIDADGGMSDIICEAEGASGGGDWNEDGIIIFATPFEANFRRQGGIGWVPASGGRPAAATTIDTVTNEFWHVSPTFLPDGERFLFSTRRGIGGENGVAVGSINGGPHRRVLDVTSNAVYVEPGYVLYWRDGALRGQRFDAKSATTTGDPFVVAAQTRFEPDSLAAMFSVSESGVLVFHPGQSATAKSRLELRDRTGEVVGTVGPDGNYYSPRFSNDGAFVAVDSSDVNNNGDIWIYGVTSPAAVRLSFDLADESRPVWSPDGQRVAFLTGKNGMDDVHAKYLRNPAVVDIILEDDRFSLEPTDWSPDGLIIAANRSLSDPGDGGDIIFIDAESGSVEPFSESPFTTEDLRFSPDGLWCLYMSNETGQKNVYLQKLDDPLQRMLVSTHGGDAPRWRSDGKELFYRSLDDQMMSVALPEGPGGPVGTPQALFNLNGRFAAAGDFDVAPDVQTFIVNTLIREKSTTPMSIVINWLSGVDAQ